MTGEKLIIKVHKKKDALHIKGVHHLDFIPGCQWDKDRMVAVPCSALPFPEPKTMENKDGQSPKTEIICILLLLLTTLLCCAGLGHFPEGWEGTGSSKRGAESVWLVPATSSRKRGTNASHISKSTSETDYIPAFLF